VAELSDGTLRYLLLVAALLSPAPPSLMVLNEPETSLHPDLLAPLARLVVTAARRTQLIIVTHAPALVKALSLEAEVAMFELCKHLGETNVSGPDKPNWNWPSRS
ncbi:MAG TPA: ATP-binding protein, partial [Hyphomonadaceae bacterium]|nr:ATP-binding protein [Hyphomonadaceae bacterium]